MYYIIFKIDHGYVIKLTLSTISLGSNVINNSKVNPVFSHF